MEMEDGGIPSTTLREISVLGQLRHPNIVEYVSHICPHNTFICLPV